MKRVLFAIWTCWFLALGASTGTAAAQEKMTIAVPRPAPSWTEPYGGSVRISLAPVEDKRFAESPDYVGVTQTGLFNHPTPLYSTEPPRLLLESAITESLRGAGLLATQAEDASLSLSVQIYSVAYAEQTFAASEYGMAEVLLLVRFTPRAAEGAAAPEASRALLVRAFEVKKAADLTKYAPQILQAAIGQAADRILSSSTLAHFLEPDRAGAFRKEFPEGRDQEKWIAKSSKLVTPDPTFKLKEAADLGSFTALRIGRLRILDKKYADRVDTAERELQQVVYTRIVGALHGRFETIDLGDPKPGEKCIVLSAELFEYAPYRPGTQGVMIGLFGPFGLLAGHGKMQGMIYLRDGESGAPLAELPFKAGASMRSNQIMVEELARSVAAYLERTKPPAADPALEVSWGRG